MAESCNQYSRYYYAEPGCVDALIELERVGVSESVVLTMLACQKR